jgi:hypothetical protein
MQAETTFLNRIFSLASPTWSVHLSPDLMPGSVGVATHNAYLYAVDTRTAWVAAGAIQPEHFLLASKWAASNGMAPTALADAVGQSIAKLGASRPAADAPEVRQCMELVAAALVHTRTFDQVRHTQDLSGHWVYVAYGMRDGSTITRPMFFRVPTVGLLPTPELLAKVRTVVQLDREPSTNVGRMLKAAGGAVLAKSFR